MSRSDFNERFAIRADEVAPLLAHLRVKHPELAETFERVLAIKAREQSAATALRDARVAADAEPGVWLSAILSAAVGAAVDAADPDLARVLLALTHASQAGRVPELLKRKGTMLGVANTFVEEGSGSALGARKPLLLKQVARLFAPEPSEKTLPDILTMLVGYFELLNAAVVLGPPVEEWRAGVLAHCLKVQSRSAALDRLPVHYVRAVLRGWGMSESGARDATKGIDF